MIDHIFQAAERQIIQEERFLPPERPDEHCERVRDGVGVTTGW